MENSKVILFVVSTLGIYFNLKGKVDDKNLVIITLLFSGVINFILHKILFRYKENFHWHSHFHPHIHNFHPHIHHVHIPHVHVPHVHVPHVHVPHVHPHLSGIMNTIEGPAKQAINGIKHLPGAVKSLEEYTAKFSKNVFQSTISSVNKNVVNKIEKDIKKAGNFVVVVSKDTAAISKHIANVTARLARKVAASELKFFKNLLNPCYWLLNGVCATAVGLADSAVIAALGSSGDDEVEESGFDAAMKSIQEGIKSVPKDQAKGVATGLVSHLIIPLLAPPLILVLSVIQPNKVGNKLFVDGMLNLTSKVLVNKLVDGKKEKQYDPYGNEIKEDKPFISFNALLLTFVNGFICSGDWYGVKISDHINGFVPVAVEGLRKAGIKC